MPIFCLSPPCQGDLGLWSLLGYRGITVLHQAVMDCTGLFLAELDIAVLCWSSLDGGGGGGKRKIKKCSGRPETAIDLAKNLK